LYKPANCLASSANKKKIPVFFPENLRVFYVFVFHSADMQFFNINSEGKMRGAKRI
jgi:hypothetical protein